MYHKGYKWFFAATILSLLAVLLSVGVTLANEDGVSNTSTWTFQLVSVASNGTQGNVDSYDAKMSADGRFVVFSSGANNLVDNDTNNLNDVFVHDRQTKTTEMVSVSSAEEQGNRGSNSPEITPNGQFVAFLSRANNLVIDDTDIHAHIQDVFVRDRQTGQTVRVSLSSTGEQGNAFSYFPTISDDGRFIAFQSTATNLVSGQTLGYDSIYIHDRQTGATSLVSISLSGKQARSSQNPHISGDGRFIVFFSEATDLVEGDTNAQGDVFIRDLQANTTSRVSVDSDSAQGNGASYEPRISADGRFVVFTSEASNLASVDTNSMADVFIHDRHTGQTIYVPTEATHGVRYPYISDNSKYVSFVAYFGNSNTDSNISLYNRESGQLMEKILPPIQSSFGFEPARVSANGVLVFSSHAALVSEDTNRKSDIYLLEESGLPEPTPTPVVHESGFQPQPNSWRFANWKIQPSWDNFKKTFGEENVEWKWADGSTIRKPMAQFHYDFIYNCTLSTCIPTGNAGVCVGMAATAALAFRNTIPLPNGVVSTNLYATDDPKRDNNDFWEHSELTEFLLTYQAYQQGAEYNNAKKVAEQLLLEETLNRIKQSIDSGLSNPYLVNIRGSNLSDQDKCLDHSVLPFAYKEGGETTVVSMYDPSSPGTPITLTINLDEDSWILPMGDSWGVWGSGRYCNEWGKQDHSISAVSINNWNTRPTPPWKDVFTEKSGNFIKYMYVSSNLNISIEGGSVTKITPTGALPGQDVGYTPYYLLEGNSPVTVTVGYQEEGASLVGLVSPNFMINVQNNATTTSITDTMLFNNEGSIEFRASAAGIRKITFINDMVDNGREVEFMGLTVEANKLISATADFALDRFSLISEATQQEHTAYFLQSGETGNDEFVITLPALEAGDTHTVTPQWKNKATIVEIDKQSDGTIDQTLLIEAEATINNLFLPLVMR